MSERSTNRAELSTESVSRDVPQLALTDEGLEAPEHLVGATGVITVEKPHLQMDITYVGDGVSEYDDHLTAFPTTGKTGYDIPEGHIRIQGTLYEIVDERILNECPECGSDKIPAGSDDPKCYNCDKKLEHPAEVNHSLTEVC